MRQEKRMNPNGLLVFILTAGVFGIINTEMGVIGIQNGLESVLI